MGLEFKWNSSAIFRLAELRRNFRRIPEVEIRSVEFRFPSCDNERCNRGVLPLLRSLEFSGVVKACDYNLLWGGITNGGGAEEVWDRVPRDWIPYLHARLSRP
jgi:hypothetical protein